MTEIRRGGYKKSQNILNPENKNKYVDYILMIRHPSKRAETARRDDHLLWNVEHHLLHAQHPFMSKGLFGSDPARARIERHVFLRTIQ